MLQVSGVAYYLASLGAALLATALVSGLVARRWWRGQRQLQALALLDALARHAAWVAAQRRAVCFQAPTQRSDPAWREIATVQRQWFPELAPLSARLGEVHGRFAELLGGYEQLRLADPEAWLEGACDAALLGLWQEHREILQAMQVRLGTIAAGGGLPVRQISAA